MSLVSRVRLCGLFAVLSLALTTLSVLAGVGESLGENGSLLDVLARGSTQVVLSVCLLAVTAALVVLGRALHGAYTDRIAALERALEREIELAKALTQNAAALDRLRTHCENMAR